MKRANVLLVAGALLLILGVALVWVLGKDDGGDSAEKKVSVLVAQADLSSGQSGDDVVAAGKVNTELVPESQVEPGALSATTGLAGQILTTNVADGDQVVATDVRAALLRTGSITIPKGKQAIAVTVDFTAGAAGYAGPGDHVNLYVNIPPNTQGAPKSPYAKLLLSDVTVLDVSNELTPFRAQTATTDSTPAAGRASTSSLTVLLALDAQQAEQVVFASSQNELWFTLLPKGQEASTTGGVDYDTRYLEGQ
ncbi:Flp pilus assembly protein CpaB [Aquihabitans sp. G128]|uniref:Flp pilus assembly protein CpaB n=1 Tax=Aquihabitans sp. G128 TaxID=2849779 RepID=UPI001C21D116|nr:Flp pilus assembly protein CpaB [Aquihabitans sp. G128]QXC61366.1 Flp pilus assembly protein CpaB [Aquihabitans sp. G128]